MNDLLFLDLDDVIALHADQLAEFGGQIQKADVTAALARIASVV